VSFFSATKSREFLLEARALLHDTVNLIFLWYTRATSIFGIAENCNMRVLFYRGLQKCRALQSSFQILEAISYYLLAVHHDACSQTIAPCLPTRP
jgi:hypothetical protein